MGGYQGGGGYPGGGGYQPGGGFGARRDNEPEMSLENLLENIELIKQNIRDMKVLALFSTNCGYLLAP